MAGVAAVQVLMTYYGGSILRTAGLNSSEWIAVVLLALTIFPIDIIRKLAVRRL